MVMEGYVFSALVQNMGIFGSLNCQIFREIKQCKCMVILINLSNNTVDGSEILYHLGWCKATLYINDGNIYIYQHGYCSRMFVHQQACTPGWGLIQQASGTEPLPGYPGNRFFRSSHVSTGKRPPNVWPPKTQRRPVQLEFKEKM